MIWFWVPASLVICNDVFAYVWGVTVGRTPLIKLSPKKTVEGFVGAFFSTVIFGIIWGTYFMQFDYMICPVQDLGASAFDEVLTCTPNPVFVWRDWSIPAPMSVFFSTLVSVTNTLAQLRTDLFITRIAWSQPHHHSLCALPIPFVLHVLFRVARCSFWRFLRIWFQTRLRHQRFWPQHPWTRRHDRSHGLPVRHLTVVIFSQPRR